MSRTGAGNRSFTFQPDSKADPDFQIRGGGHTDSGNKGVGASFWSKSKGGRPPRAPPLDPPLRFSGIFTYMVNN